MVVCPVYSTETFDCQTMCLSGISEWVLRTVTSVYTLQFYRRPPRFSSVMMSTVLPQDAPTLYTEVCAVLDKHVEVVPPEDCERGFYS
ncbi:hypothetical protein QQF64_006529 [Cirrhinus molitorella]|uniref:Uncharacterized protein n=1 Tax=Cirrhinus molitorella TaxID=172907 RepID=A0ABR3MB53_9TELE